MNHVALLKSLPPDVKARLTARSDAAGLRHLAVYLSALAMTSAGIVMQVPLWPLLMAPQGILLVFLFTLSHECTHQTPFASRWINETVGHAIAPLLMLPFMWFRYFHLAHHKFTNNPDHDPELAGGGRPDTRRRWGVYLSGWGYWRGNLRVLMVNAFGPITAPYLPRSRHAAMRREARAILVFYVVTAFSLTLSPVALWVWIVPVLIGQPVLRLYLLAEHGLCPPVADMLENSRTTLTGRLVRFLAWNMPYHAEHHSLPSVPFHLLPSFHLETRAHLKSTSEGYGAFTRAYLRSLER
jgi:fatty acid desaturase